MIIVGGNDDNAGVDNGDDDNVNNDNKNVNDDDDAGSPSRVLLYALSGWVERFNLSWMVLLNTFPVSKIHATGRAKNFGRGNGDRHDDTCE